MKGFSLVEIIITIFLGLLIVTLLSKTYQMRLSIHHQIEDIIFLDHHGVLAMKILKNVQGKFKAENHGLWLKKRGYVTFQEVVSGVETLTYHSKDKVIITLKAPYGTTATFSEKLA